jgi:pimeloyl-ACP methyl ester carboxylesterase
MLSTAEGGCADEHDSKDDAMNETGLRTVTTPLLEVACFDLGDPAAPAVLLLHGWPDDARTWSAVAPVLTGAGYRVLAPYLRGYGPTRFRADSTPRSGQLAALGQDVIDLIEALELPAVALVGHDWGARAAAVATAALQASGRVTHMAMLSVGYGTSDPNQTLSLKQMQNYWYHWLMALPRGLALVRDEREAFARHLWQVWSPNWRCSEAEFAATVASFDNPDWAEVAIHYYRHRWGFAEGDARYAALEARLTPAPQITVPALMLHGADDACNDPATSAGKEGLFEAPYRRVVLDGVGHFPQREAPVAVAREVLALLSAPLRAPAASPPAPPSS